MSNSTGATKKLKLAPVRVFLRIRPTHAQDGPSAVTYCTPKEICVKGHSKTYFFDQIFDENTSQNKVYNTVVGSIISDVVKGYNCTVFAYGQTGTGKTYTILGGDTTNFDDEQFDRQGDSDAGIIIRAAKHLYEELDKIDQSVQYTVTVSFMEIYNEEIRDLLCDKEVVPLRIYESKTKTVRVQNLQEVTVLNIWDIYRLLKKGCQKRQTASTLMNNRSSRSHTVFTINVSTIQTISVAGNLSNIICGKLSLIDLAGSENSAKSGSKDQRAREATNINQSLLTLGRVIKALVENSTHIPYRESKLTRILQDSLGGKTKTAIIATISPGVSSLEETVNTLDYAYSARHVTNCPTINLRTSAAAAAVHEEVIRLKRDLFATANEQGVYMDKENYEDMTRSLSEFKKDIVIKHETIQSLTEKLDDLSAQKEEWDNLRKSFEITRKAYQECQTKMQSTMGIMKKDQLLLDYYENEIVKSQEFTEWMATRENYLHEKVDSLYGTSNSNKKVIESIIETVEEALDVIVSQDSQNSEELGMKVERLIHFNKNISLMLNNVEKQLGDKSCQCTEISVSFAASKNQRTNNPLSKSFWDYIDYIENMLETFIERCDNKLTRLKQKIEETETCISAFERLVQESKESIIDEVVGKKVQIEKFLTEDIKCTKKLFEEIEETEIGRMGCLSRVLLEANDQLLRDQRAWSNRSDQLSIDQDELKRREELTHQLFRQLLRDKESLKIRNEQLIRDQIEFAKREQQISSMRQLNEGQSYRDDFAKHLEGRNIKKEAICDFKSLETNILVHSQKVLQEVPIIKNLMLQSMEIHNILHSEEIKSHIEKLQAQAFEFTQGMEKLLATMNKDYFDMASVVKQISSILDFEGNVQLEQLSEMVDSQVRFFSAASKEIKLKMHQIFNTSFVPVNRSGDTPKPIEAQRSVRSSRDSIIKKLVLDNSTQDPSISPS